MTKKLRFALLFDSILLQARLLDERCTDAAATSYTVAIEALAQLGLDEACATTTRPRKEQASKPSLSIVTSE